MIAVDQTSFGAPRSIIATREMVVGNCFSACVASVLELPIAEVPLFFSFEDSVNHNDDPIWWRIFQLWLEVHGIVAVCYVAPSPPIPGWPEGYSLAGGVSPRNGIMHECVALDGVLVHDPNPDRTFFAGPIVDFIVMRPLLTGENYTDGYKRITGT